MQEGLVPRRGTRFDLPKRPRGMRPSGTITRLEANLTLILLNRRTIDVKSSARPTKIVMIAM